MGESARHRQVMIEPDLDALLVQHVEQTGTSISAVLRVALRDYLARTSGGDDRWRAGFNAGWRAAQERARRALFTEAPACDCGGADEATGSMQHAEDCALFGSRR